MERHKVLKYVGWVKIVTVTLSYSITTKSLPLSCYGLQKPSSCFGETKYGHVPMVTQDTTLIGTKRNFFLILLHVVKLLYTDNNINITVLNDMQTKDILKASISLKHLLGN